MRKIGFAASKKKYTQFKRISNLSPQCVLKFQPPFRELQTLLHWVTVLALKELVCPLHIKERVSQRAPGGQGDGSTGAASQHGFSGSYNTTNRSYFYRRLPLAKHMLLAFALKETCQTQSLPFNCLICNRKDFLRNQQARQQLGS